MTDFKLQNGRVREIEAVDLPTLIQMCEDRDIQEFYFAKEVPSMEGYWQERLADQLEERKANGWIRNKYHLPIENQGVVQGLLTVSVQPYTYWSSEDSGPDKHGIELSYFVGSEFRRQGLATEVLNQAIPFSFDELDAGTVCGVCLKENGPSQDLLRKVGLEKKWEGVSQQRRAKGREVVVYGCDLVEYSRANKKS